MNHYTVINDRATRVFLVARKKKKGWKLRNGRPLALWAWKNPFLNFSSSVFYWAFVAGLVVFGLLSFFREGKHLFQSAKYPGKIIYSTHGQVDNALGYICQDFPVEDGCLGNILLKGCPHVGSKYPCPLVVGYRIGPALKKQNNNCLLSIGFIYDAKLCQFTFVVNVTLQNTVTFNGLDVWKKEKKTLYLKKIL